MKKRLLSVVLALALALSLPGLLLPAEAAVSSFPDVKSTDWFYPYVTELAQVGGVHGYPDGTFKPNNNISRAEVAAIAADLFSTDEYLEVEFEDDNDIIPYIRQSVEERVGANHWAKEYIARAILCRVKIEPEDGSWDQPATRADIAHILSKMYTCAMYGQGKLSFPISIPGEAAWLIGDYDKIEGTTEELDICWLYSEGIVSGINAQGDFNPSGKATRAECCKIVLNLLRPERRDKIDWDNVQPPNTGTGSGQGIYDEEGYYYEKDFTGKNRIRFPEDVAFDYCRALENEIGIQIFYMPGEWTEKPVGLFSSTQQAYAISDEMSHGIYTFYEDVLTELKKMKAAFDLYPKGFLKEMAQKKGNRGAEIILSPYSFDGSYCHGIYLYDESSDAKKVDQVYYSGVGYGQHYSHEMGHMVTSAVAILNGFNSTCNTWDGLGKGHLDSYVSAYAMTSRAEDWAETWAYLWHQPQTVMEACSDAGLKAKVQYLTEILETQYSTFQGDKTPWADILK